MITRKPLKRWQNFHPIYARSALLILEKNCAIRVVIFLFFFLSPFTSYIHSFRSQNMKMGDSASNSSPHTPPPPAYSPSGHRFNNADALETSAPAASRADAGDTRSLNSLDLQLAEVCTSLWYHHCITKLTNKHFPINPLRYRIAKFILNPWTRLCIFAILAIAYITLQALDDGCVRKFPAGMHKVLFISTSATVGCLVLMGGIYKETRENEIRRYLLRHRTTREEREKFRDMTKRWQDERIFQQMLFSLSFVAFVCVLLVSTGKLERCLEKAQSQDSMGNSSISAAQTTQHPTRPFSF